MLLLQQEMKLLYDAANRYLEGAGSVHELNGIAASCADLAARSDVPEGFCELFSEWLEMVNRRWNEFGLAKNAVSEDEFKAWLRTQLPFRSYDSV